MASKKLIALSMLCYLLDGQSEITFVDLQQPELGFEHSGKYPFTFASALEANELVLPNVPKVHWHQEAKKSIDNLKITFAGNVQWRKWIAGLDTTPEWIESIAVKRYTHYLKTRLGDSLRSKLQDIYRVLFNGIPRKALGVPRNCVVDTENYSVSWRIDDWVLIADLNALVGATIESVEYVTDMERYLLIIIENYHSFSTTHYVDLLLHSTPLAELKRRAIDNRIVIGADLLNVNTTQLPITVMPMRSDRVLTFKLL